jgi:hypothetical protein
MTYVIELTQGLSDDGRVRAHAGMCHWVKNEDGFWVCSICGRPK